MKKYFSLRFYLDTLIRLRTVTIVLIAVFSGLSAMSGIGYLIAYISAKLSSVKINLVTGLDLVDITAGITSFIYLVVPIMTVSAFSFLMKRSDSDFYEALPIEREAMLLSGLSAVLTSAAAIITASSVVGIAVITPCFGKTVEYDFLIGFVQALGYFLSAALAAVGTAVAISFTGTRNSAWFSAMMLLLAPRMVLALINNSVAELDLTLVSGHVIPLFDNNYNLFSALFLDNEKVLLNPWAYLYTFVLSAVYLCLARILFKKRKSEFATHSFTSKLARHLVSGALAVYVAMLGVYLICLDKWLLVIALFVFAISVGVYFAFEIVTGRREKSFMSTLKAFPVFVCVTGALACSVFLSAKALGNYSPNPEQIDSVSLSSELGSDTFGYISYDQYVTLRSQNVKLTDDESKKIVADALKRGYDKEDSRAQISIVLKIDSGLVNYRKVYFTPEEYSVLIQILSEDEEYKSLWMQICEGASHPVIYGTVDIEDEGAYRVLRTMEAEIVSMGFDKWFELCNSPLDQTAATINYSVMYERELYTVSLNIYQNQLPETYRVYIEERQKAADKLYQKLKNDLTSAAQGGEELNLSMTLFADSFYDINAVISDDDYSRALVSEMFTIVSSESFDYGDGYYISVSVYGDGLSSDSYYIDLMVPEDKIQSAIEYFKENGSGY